MQAEKTLLSLETVLFNSSPGWANKEALNEIKKHISSLKFACSEVPQATFFLDTINDYSAVLFSERKHDNHGGVEKVTHILRIEFQKLGFAIKRAKA